MCALWVNKWCRRILKCDKLYFYVPLMFRQRLDYTFYRKDVICEDQIFNVRREWVTFLFTVALPRRMTLWGFIGIVVSKGWRGWSALRSASFVINRIFSINEDEMSWLNAYWHIFLFCTQFVSVGCVDPSRTFHSFEFRANFVDCSLGWLLDTFCDAKYF